MELIQWSWLLWCLFLLIFWSMEKILDYFDAILVKNMITIVGLLSFCFIICIPVINISLIGEIDKSKTKVDYFIPDTIIKTNYVTYVLNFNNSISLCSSNAAIYNRDEQMVIQRDSYYSFYNNLLDSKYALNMAETNSP